MKTTAKMFLSLLLIAALGYAVSEIPVYGKTKGGGKEKTRNEKIAAIVYSSVMPLVKEAENRKDADVESFSRCPSGYRHQLAKGEYEKTESSEDYNTAYGKIVYYLGCAKSNHVCDFKIDLNTSSAWVKDKDAQEYMTVDKWVSSKKKSADING